MITQFTKIRWLVFSPTLATFLLWATSACAALTPQEQDYYLKLLGKHVFFDDNLSIPRKKQACASCHDPAKGWVLPNSQINNSTVGAPGAKPHTEGGIKPPSNAYASFSPPFRPCTVPDCLSVIPSWEGGSFWNGRAEGYGHPDAETPGVPQGDGVVSRTVTVLDLGARARVYSKYLGPTADQALNPFTSGGGEQNIPENIVCQRVKTGIYNKLYNLAFGEAIDCRGNLQKPAGQPYDTVFKRIAVAIAAWQTSTDVNSFSSRRDKALACDADGQFPLVADAGKCRHKARAELRRLTFTAQENLGHDLFYNRNDSGLNNGGNNGTPKNAGCTTCHVGVPEGESADPIGVGPHQLYTDNRYRNIGVPFNRQIPRARENPQTGLNAHVSFNDVEHSNPNVLDGEFKTPTLRNVAKGVSSGFVKAYGHNGYFKSLKSIVHFYNTRDVLQRCEDLNIIDATEAEALANNCWPKPEFDNAGVAAGDTVIGNLGLTETEEDALVAYLKTFSDEYTPTNP